MSRSLELCHLPPPPLSHHSAGYLRSWRGGADPSQILEAGIADIYSSTARATAAAPHAGLEKNLKPHRAKEICSSPRRVPGVEQLDRGEVARREEGYVCHAAASLLTQSCPQPAKATWKSLAFPWGHCLLSIRLCLLSYLTYF